MRHLRHDLRHDGSHSRRVSDFDGRRRVLSIWRYAAVDRRAATVSAVASPSRSSHRTSSATGTITRRPRRTTRRSGTIDSVK